jgi:hypothetical protein
MHDDCSNKEMYLSASKKKRVKKGFPEARPDSRPSPRKTTAAPAPDRKHRDPPHPAGPATATRPCQRGPRPLPSPHVSRTRPAQPPTSPPLTNSPPPPSHSTLLRPAALPVAVGEGERDCPRLRERGRRCDGGRAGAPVSLGVGGVRL